MQDQSWSGGPANTIFRSESKLDGKNLDGDGAAGQRGRGLKQLRRGAGESIQIYEK